MIHSLDHLVLPTASLDVARARLTALGFRVAPRGKHPFGTENCCVYLADGTFLEPLAVGDAVAAGQAVAEGNVFVARDRAWRAVHGEDGFSAIVFGTNDADADHARYVEAGVSAGNRLDFSRPFIDAAGKSDTVSFRLAFAAGGGASDSFAFACERVNAPEVDRAALQKHANGAAAIREVVAVSSGPDVETAFLTIAAGAPGGAVSADILTLPNAKITTVTPQAFRDRFGVQPVSASGLRFAAVVFQISDSDAVARLLSANTVEYRIFEHHIVIDAAPGQGAIFIFEERA
ncbi:lactoylglutathione lyase [Mesorhizobium sp. Root554]|uniref:VOC family protein n=1 Tax=unclassified Mesorhizobium TaxID=325217 RepID=UPI0006F436A0|nr:MULTISPECIES: VOC family protein [unclassified Mesorhizobium]KQZ13684.1 lactoylglutathione lyase [Mesorhizobium sp. Root1471]KQZ36195.1 lactoylglutathione lyase [Mesorhizobium sp. Root554]